LSGLRLAGKRSLASLNSFDLVVLLSISNTVQNAIIGNDASVTGGLIGAATLLTVNYLVVRFFFEHPRLDRLAEGDKTLLIDKGRLIEQNLRAELISRTELEAAAHRQGFRALDEVERAELDPGGALAFFGKQPSIEERYQTEVTRRLDAITEQLARLQARLDETMNS
jgi:uncharacterized membrane protein YcaP (DUF421 family)